MKCYLSHQEINCNFYPNIDYCKKCTDVYDILDVIKQDYLKLIEQEISNLEIQEDILSSYFTTF